MRVSAPSAAEPSYVRPHAAGSEARLRPKPPQDLVAQQGPGETCRLKVFKTPAVWGGV